MSEVNHRSHAMPVRQALWNLQKELLNNLKHEFDRENGYEAAPVEWFQALMTAERYTWLREMTSLMADIDILTELDFITEQHVAVARHEIERLFFNQDASTSAFSESYSNTLMSGIGLLPLHNQLRSTLQSLPSKKMPIDQALAERKNWQEEHRHQSRKKRN